MCTKCDVLSSNLFIPVMISRYLFTEMELFCKDPTVQQGPSLTSGRKSEQIASLHEFTLL